MAKATEAKANVERTRLTFDKGKWPSEAEKRSVELHLDRERFAFEKAKRESEREDRRSAMQLQQRFHMLSSLIKKGHNVGEAKDFLALM
ncbi:hypothetical protein DVH05_008748 [Phytophthora capsici]|nr:hypothetical protein DVH05_008748 [Phytophthora capsici]